MIYESIFSLHVLLISGIACLIQLLMLALLMPRKSFDILALYKSDYYYYY